MNKYAYLPSECRRKRRGEKGGGRILHRPARRGKPYRAKAFRRSLCAARRENPHPSQLRVFRRTEKWSRAFPRSALRQYSAFPGNHKKTAVSPRQMPGKTAGTVTVYRAKPVTDLSLIHIFREGVYKSFSVTQEHFAEEYGQKIRYFIYNSSQLTKVEKGAGAAGSVSNWLLERTLSYDAYGNQTAEQVYTVDTTCLLYTSRCV